MRTREQASAIRSGLAVGLAVSAYGVSFGALSVAAGLDIWQTCVLSLLMFSGGSQFALIGVLASGGTAAGFAAIMSAVLLGIRNGVYAIRVSPIVGPGWAKRLLAAHWTIDESTAVATAQTTPEGQRTGFWWTGGIIFVGWNLATLLGALIGDLLGDVRQYGLDAAAAAAFLGLLWPRLRSLQPIAVAAASAILATVLVPVLPAGVNVLLAALVAVVVGIFNLLGSPDPRVGPARATGVAPSAAPDTGDEAGNGAESGPDADTTPTGAEPVTGAEPGSGPGSGSGVGSGSGPVPVPEAVIPGASPDGDEHGRRDPNEQAHSGEPVPDRAAEQTHPTDQGPGTASQAPDSTAIDAPVVESGEVAEAVLPGASPDDPPQDHHPERSAKAGGEQQ